MVGIGPDSIFVFLTQKILSIFLVICKGKIGF